ncbi:hypothetical protein CROQUDRAFT_477602 [Cronartium quercuum f. sp. fusiforme G11]|uniref:Uncharacterized protein n=1 Tax=Cronartium quercuum f. sp. fusiforme G11 TaxID=708437 RepID=A0A9P6TD62_9BASI|nr:hypothetical protein CROQUDRAFT_477602 [Cronartium quercuum f. sp. fusiforme G11]
MCITSVVFQLCFFFSFSLLTSSHSFLFISPRTSLLFTTFRCVFNETFVVNSYPTKKHSTCHYFGIFLNPFYLYGLYESLFFSP